VLLIDEYQYRFVLEQGDKDDLDLIGWQVDDERALSALADQLTAAEVAVQRGSAAEAEARRVVELIKFKDPSGISSEAFYGALTRIDIPFKPARSIGGFVASGMELGHITMGVDDMQQSLAFYREVLGMRLSDWVQPQPERDVKSRFNIAFLHCNRRHHSLAFWQARMPKRLHHFMLQLESLDDVGATYDLCQQRGVPLELTLGGHTNDRIPRSTLSSLSDSTSQPNSPMMPQRIPVGPIPSVMSAIISSAMLPSLRLSMSGGWVKHTW
jgi:biphenyl-2,3-diol 1,2-dioxygenase